MRFIRAFRGAPSGMVGLGAIAGVLLVAVLAPPLFGHSANAIDVVNLNANPSAAHPLGTDQLGRDIFLRILVATRLSVGLGLAAVALSIVIGLPFGAFIALLPPQIRPVGLRTIDMLIAFPALLVAIYVTSIVGPGALGPVLGVGLAYSFGLARLVSTLTMSVGGRDYIQAARVVGVRRSRLLLRHVMPNIAEVLVVGISTSITYAIVTIAGLSFLGLGVQFPDFDWGNMLSVGVQEFYVTPAAALGPAVTIAVAALAFGFSGEAMARAMNPLLWVEAVSQEKTQPVTASADREAGPDSDKELFHIQDTIAGMQWAGADRQTVLQVRDLKVVFPGPSGPVNVVAGVSFDVKEGEILGIVGESGSGKTMTSLAIARLVPFPGKVTGEIRLGGYELAALPRVRLDKLLGTRLSVVFQDPMASLNPALTIGTQLTEGVERHRGLAHRAATRLSVAKLKEVNIPVPEVQIERHPHELSGGMRQRVMIAMGLMHDVKLLIADEPTTALDVTIQAQIMDLLANVNEAHSMAVILISHNLGLVSQNCDRMIVMYAGRIVEEIPTSRLTIDPLHPYTAALLAAVPDMTYPRDLPLHFIRGEAPDIASPPSGCPFHPRCPLAVEKCSVAMPPLIRRSADRSVACWVANGDV